MMGDGFEASEIDRYFSGELMTVAAPATVAAAPIADPRFEKYDKMRKMLPEGAVRQKMMGDGFEASEIDRYFSGELMTVAAPATVAAAPIADPRFEKYDKMRKMLPEGAVRQKMTGDGFTASEIDRFFSGEVMTVTTVAPATAAAPDPRFEKYDKMRKMLPEGAVRQKMSGDGFTPAEIEGFFNPGGATKPAAAAFKTAVKAVIATPVVELPPEGMAPKPKVVPATKLKGVFWSKLKAAEVQGTVWHKLKDHKLSSADVARLEEWFSAKVAEPSAADKLAAAAKAALAAAQPKAIAVLDGKRTQNVSLIIGKIRRDPEGITKLIVDLDPSELTAELTSMLFSILPTPEGEIILASLNCNFTFFFLQNSRRSRTSPIHHSWTRHRKYSSSSIASRVCSNAWSVTRWPSPGSLTPTPCPTSSVSYRLPAPSWAAPNNPWRRCCP
jgi:hypothetical protein